MQVCRLADKGVGISNKSVTSLRAFRSRSKTAPQTETTEKNHRHSVSRYIKIGIVSFVVLSLVGSQLVGRVASEARYVAPQARFENPIQVKDLFITKPKLAVGEKIIENDDYWNYVVNNYRNYYNEMKQHLFKWTNRETPEWIK